MESHSDFAGNIRRIFGWRYDSTAAASVWNESSLLSQILDGGTAPRQQTEFIIYGGLWALVIELPVARRPFLVEAKIEQGGR